uniref:1-acyl-sn-glycerol-3-phosphate acyltransferase n=1 Tax=Meloidogyne javanica TaxID=6303 RepID=A0A915LLB0_MELJA
MIEASLVILFVLSTLIGLLASYGGFTRFGCIVAMNSFNFICSFWLDIDFEIRGLEKIEEASGPENKPVVLISNHQSSLDLFTLSKMWPSKTTIMMKSSLKYVPIFNIGAIMSNSIFVDRNNKNNAKEALNDAITKMKDKKLKVWVFPEGTRHHQHGLLPFKKGAFNIAVQAQFPIIPIVISDYTPFYSKKEKYFYSGGKLEYNDVCQLCENVQQKMAQEYEKISEEAANKMKKNSVVGNERDSSYEKIKVG